MTNHDAFLAAGADLVDLIDEQFAIRVYADDGSGVVVPEGFALIPAGTFQMGSPTDEPGAAMNGRPCTRSP